MVETRRSSSSSKCALSSPPPTTAKRSKIAVEEVLEKVPSELIWPHFAIASIGSGFNLIDAFRLVELSWMLINQSGQHCTTFEEASYKKAALTKSSSKAACGKLFSQCSQIQIHQDMTAPVSNYFIYTGHNSYLTGNQLNSDCSVLPIIKALKRGVRVVEIDLWPNNDAKDGVHVYHGWTLTTPVELIECLESIREHAFSSSPYPIIITLEDHLTADLQAKVAQLITQAFENMLLYPESECLKEIPAPEELKYRFIISTKPPKEFLQAKSSKEKMEKSLKGKDSDEQE